MAWPVKWSCGWVMIGARLAWLQMTAAHCAEGIVAEGIVAEGIVAEGIVAEGVVAEGIVAEGVVAEGVVAEGIVAEGVVAEGVYVYNCYTWTTITATGERRCNPRQSFVDHGNSQITQSVFKNQHDPKTKI